MGPTRGTIGEGQRTVRIRIAAEHLEPTQGEPPSRRQFTDAGMGNDSSLPVNNIQTLLLSLLITRGDAHAAIRKSVRLPNWATHSHFPPSHPLMRPRFCLHK